VAREAGVGKGTIYRNFVDKDDLLFQMATSGFDELCDILKQKIPENGRFEQKLLRACKHISRFFAGRRQLFQVMQSDTAQIYWPRGKFHNKWMQQRHKLVSAVANILSEGVRERVVRSDISADVLAAFLLGMLRTRGRELPEVSESVKSHELLVNIFLKGAGPNLEDSCE
jgi:AcrR family transcriptional regulator